MMTYGGELLSRLGGVPKGTCLNCGHRVNGALHPGDEAATPRVGDLAICIRCGNLMGWGQNFELRELSGDELAEIDADPELSADIRAMQEAIESVAGCEDDARQ